MPHIGTAGWNIPKQHAHGFPPQGSHLQRYASILNAVEINSSFYRPHRRATYERWARSVPEEFRFAVKVPREATHESRLVECETVLERFLDEVAGLGVKLGVLLVQLPASFDFQVGVAEAFFDWLAPRSTARIACEPRHPSWFTPRADRTLRDRAIARVAADPKRAAEAGEPGGTQDLVYYRLHGSPRMYYSNYDAAALEALRKQLEPRLQHGSQVWCIFDNTADFAATANALSLKRALSQCRT